MKPLLIIAISYIPTDIAASDHVAGTWNSITLSGSLKKLSPKLNNFHWVILEQAWTRTDSSNGMRFFENLLFGQIGYSINENASIWLGYSHDWSHPLDEPAFQEDRPYQAILWKSTFGDLKFTSRFRLEQRIRQDTGNVGVRARQLFQVNYPLKSLDKDLSFYVGDEVLCYINENTFGRTGFSENRAFGGVSYQLSVIS